MSRLPLKPRRLSTQMILSFIAVVLLTAVAAWFPEITLIRDQLEEQAWAQVEQGRRTTQALYRSWQGEVINAAILASQLPSLHELLRDGTPGELERYLEQLKAGLGIDIILICDGAETIVAGLSPAAAIPPSSVCDLEETSPFRVLEAGPESQIFLLAHHPISDDAVTLGRIIVGVNLDDAFAAEMSAQTGFEHTLLVNGRPAATSFRGGVARWSTTRQSDRTVGQDALTGRTFSVDDVPYYADRLTLDEEDIQDEIALQVTDIATTKQRLFRTITVSILAVVVVGSLAGVVLARRIGTPLVRLAQAATTFSKGNLETPVAIETDLQETVQVAQALEQARVDLRRTLSDLRREKAWIEHVLGAIVEGIVILDEHGNVSFFSKGAERITGWRHDDVAGRHCDDVFRPTENREPFSELIPPPEQRRKITVALARGQQTTLSVTRAELVPPDAKEAHVALVFRDVTEEEAIQRLLGHFLANMTHEFRTPLSALEASIELLLDQGEDLRADEREELLVSLYLGILGLQRLVDNLLESASLEAGRFQVSPRPTPLGSIVAEATHMMQPLLDKYDQRLVVDLPATLPIVQADPQRTVQALVNLLSNASKYGPQDAEVVIAALVENGWVRLSVADEGPGISPEYKDDLFRRFAHYGSDENKAEYGAGLGLWIVKAIVEAHGGEVGVEARDGKGSIFWFTLPLVEET